MLTNFVLTDFVLQAATMEALRSGRVVPDDVLIHFDRLLIIVFISVLGLILSPISITPFATYTEFI